jgi:hypothetical protein
LVLARHRVGAGDTEEVEMSEHESPRHDEGDTGLDPQGRDRKARLLREVQGEESPGSTASEGAGEQ